MRLNLSAALRRELLWSYVQIYRARHVRRPFRRPRSASPSLRVSALTAPAHVLAVGQLPQTAYHSLLTPYSFFGLGRTNNYIENLFVGSTKHADGFINMEGVIPNSKVVIIPPRAGESGDSWRKELYLRPGRWIPWVGVSVVASMIVLAIMTFVLHLNEKVRRVAAGSAIRLRLIMHARSARTSWTGGGRAITLISTRCSIYWSISAVWT